MINKFISGLSPIERRILTAASLFVLLALFDRLLIGPSLGRLRDIDDSIVKQETTIRQNMMYLAHRDRIQKEAAVYNDFYAKDVRAEEEIIAEFLKRMELMATQSQVELSKVAPAGQDYQKDYIKYLVTLDCSGKLENIANFVYSINNARELLRVEKMNINGNSKDVEKVLANLTISRLIIGVDPSMDAKALVKTKGPAAESAAVPAGK